MLRINGFQITNVEIGRLLENISLMTETSRTTNSIKNAKVALIYYFINLVLQFYSRKIFLEYLGAEILGLNTTAMNLLQFLNLAELGIGSAISYSLYAPLAKRSYNEVNEIVSVQGFLYRKIGFFVLFTSGLLMCFFPLVFEKSSLPNWYAFASFFVLLLSNLAGYFFNYKQIVLSADQKDYKLNYITQSVKLLKILLQIVFLIYFENGYLWWLFWELIATFFTIYGVDLILKKEYSWLKANLSDGKYLRVKYPEITIKTKQLFFHRIGSFALQQTSPLILYAYTSLTLVAVYGNYMLVITGTMALLNAVFNSMNAGVGNLVAENNKLKIKLFFLELFSFRFLLVATISFILYILINPFIILWVGSQYLLDDISVVLLIVTLYLNTMRNVIDSFVNAYGLFQDIWAPIVEASINILSAIVLGYFYGINGVLCGVLLSLFIVVFCWKPYFLIQKKVLDLSIFEYLFIYIKHLAAFVFTLLVMLWLISLITIDLSSILIFIIYAVAICISFFMILSFFLYLLTDGMRLFIGRFYKLVNSFFL